MMNRSNEQIHLCNFIEKKFVVSSMFNYYDANGNSLLDREELLAIEHLDHLDRLSQTCHLSDLLNFDDLDHETNGTISKTEFFTAFSVYYFVFLYREGFHKLVLYKFCGLDSGMFTAVELMSFRNTNGRIRATQILRGPCTGLSF